MELHAIETGRFRLDGGAMFGVVPRTLWSRTNPPDAQNRIDMAMRCLLIVDGARVILVDNGLGDKYDEKFKGIYLVDHSVTLESSLAAVGLEPADVTDVVLTHLHFDHAGGTTRRNPATGALELTFPNATHYVQESHLQWALKPNAREKASFFTENIQPLVESERLKTLQGPGELFPGFELRIVNGHTEAQQLPLIRYKDKQILYVADLFPTFGHIPLPYVMGYDVRPLVTMDERAGFLPWMADNEVVLFYEHDPEHECGLVARNERGGYVSGETFPLHNLG